MSVLETKSKNLDLYLFDREAPPGKHFLGAARYGQEKVTHITEADDAHTTLHKSSPHNILDRHHSYELPVGPWTMVVVSTENAYDAGLVFVIVGGVMIIVACILLALFAANSFVRMARENALRAANSEEKAMLCVQHAKSVAADERNLNDFLSHEVRNPLSASIAALSFVSASFQSPATLHCAETRASIQEDLGIMEESLKFIDDLLRSMLDLHRASMGEMKLKRVPCNVRREILEPVAALLYARGKDFKVVVEAPSNLIIQTDPLRLKQVVLNLGRNSSKFVTQGFIKLMAGIDKEGRGFLNVEDSGPGIPPDKQLNLFKKIQESLDTLHQGTGVGLSLCKYLVDMLEGRIWLDKSYDSGIRGSPGAKFVVQLGTAMLDDTLRARSDSENGIHDVVGPKYNEEFNLPRQASILFVDDDKILRKLFRRAIQKALPEWDVQEASSGEEALEKVETHKYDVIFIDQYMADVQRRLLGSETIVKLRERGVTGKICGLSANNLEQVFIESGANGFLLKPFPTKPDELEHRLRDLFHSSKRVDRRPHQCSSN